MTLKRTKSRSRQPRPTHDLAVVGGGSGGFGAALAAARQGLRVLLIEPGAMLGGTSTMAGINTWEPVVGGPGLPAELYRRLATVPAHIGVSRTVHHWMADEPWGLSRVDRRVAYEASLRRHQVPLDLLTRVTFEPGAMAAATAELLLATGRVDLRLGWRVVGAEAKGDRVESLRVAAAGREERVRTKFVIDSTGDLAVATLLGCRTDVGAEARATYGEPDAPEAHQDVLNGVSLCYRATPTSAPAVEPLPRGLEPTDRLVTHSITEYPGGDLNFNPLPLMDGMEFHRLGYEAGRHECLDRVYQTWHWLQTAKGFDGYRLVWIAPMVGIREGPRLVGRHILTEQECLAGCSGQNDPERWITLADHALDTHGRDYRCREMTQPYGVPYECLLPVEYTNLAVACRGASFSHLAVSSCRLTRTMMHLGQAAGLAVAAAVARRTQLPDVDLGLVRRWLAAADVALDPQDRRFGGPVPAAEH